MRLAPSMLLALAASCATPREQPVREPVAVAAEEAQSSSGFYYNPDGNKDFICTTPGDFGQAWIDSNHGAYGVRIAPEPSDFPDNEAFRFEVWITRTTIPGASLEPLTLTVDAAMPQHGHGMNRVPRVSRLEPGHFLVEGMYFHMTGKWELYLDITDGALTERAQYVVELADE